MSNESSAAQRRYSRKLRRDAIRVALSRPRQWRVALTILVMPSGYVLARKRGWHDDPVADV
jgi:hypothetical protein